MHCGNNDIALARGNVAEANNCTKTNGGHGAAILWSDVGARFSGQVVATKITHTQWQRKCSTWANERIISH